ncbi:unnamed protein product [Owenia fusiformis]|uniref:Uncharacterized protein n=1 Tax=Owenia fusiformis TaxID=6347 RepID=A0A8J1UDR2_OWEFU|nr:unnamed protein product [Owenia fusiformis]
MGVTKGAPANTSLMSKLLDAQAANHRRLMRINEAEQARTKNIFRIIDKHARMEQLRTDKALERVNHTWKEIKAYNYCVHNQYKVSNFICMQKDFKLKSTSELSADSRRRLHYETRIMNTGFSRDILRPEIKRAIIDNDPKMKREVQREKLLESAKNYQALFPIDRKSSTTKIFENFHTTRNNFTKPGQLKPLKNHQMAVLNPHAQTVSRDYLQTLKTFRKHAPTVKSDKTIDVKVRVGVEPSQTEDIITSPTQK